jgi:putative membrane protein
MLATFALGYLVEVLGVHTGWVFGQYDYGQTLGPQIAKVPLAMGLNWFIMCYVSTRFAAHLGLNAWKGAVLSAAMMVAIDILMEPVAMALDFWHWENGQIPYQNYLAWFVVSFGINYWWFGLSNKGLNNFSHWVLGYLALFFAVMHMAFAA